MSLKSLPSVIFFFFLLHFSLLFQLSLTFFSVLRRSHVVLFYCMRRNAANVRFVVRDWIGSLSWSSSEILRENSTSLNESHVSRPVMSRWLCLHLTPIDNRLVPIMRWKRARKCIRDCLLATDKILEVWRWQKDNRVKLEPHFFLRRSYAHSESETAL